MPSSVLHRDFQYATADYQAETAIAGMWLFLATEVLFFGGLMRAPAAGQRCHAAIASASQ